MINAEMCERVAKAIEDAPKKFNLGNFGEYLGGHQVSTAKEILHRCDTTACVCGWVLSLAFDPESDELFDISDTVKGAELLGLTYEEGYSLFYGSPRVWGMSRPLYDATAEDAVRVLRALADGSLVVNTDDWHFDTDEWHFDTDEYEDEE